MKRIITLLILISASILLKAQVEQTIVVEHFTNSRCGVCALKNPGLYQNLADNPEVLHIAFHPSKPYANCIFSMENPVENDDRTKMYSIFGGTPWIVIQGEVQSSGTNFGDPGLFDPFYGQTSPFSIFIKENRYDENNILIDVTIHAVGEHSLGNASLFLGFVEDTVFYEAPNGEDLHPNVFRKAITEVTGDVISLPSTGDSVTFSYTVSPSMDWDIDRMYTMALIQDLSDQSMMQAGKTDLIEYNDPSFINSLVKPTEKLHIYPNPTVDFVMISDPMDDVILSTIDGRQVIRVDNPPEGQFRLDISTLKEGIYILKSGNRTERMVVIK